MKKRLNINIIISFVSVLALMVFLGLKYDYYFDLNDDVLMKDILSGVYNGAPDAFNIQMLFPISLVISFLYRINTNLPWYGLVLIAFQYGSLFIIVERSLSLKMLRNKKIVVKILTALSEILLLGILMAEHLVNLQYTITVAMMASAAVALIASSDASRDPLHFLINNIPAIVIIFIAFLLRSEMMLLMLPFVCAIGVFKWSFENKILNRVNIAKYCSVFIVILGSLIVGLSLNKIAYSKAVWREFVDLFDARTELYDYQAPVPYEGNEEFYESISFNKDDAYLFKNYNYGLNASVDSKLMWQVASYAGGINKSSVSFGDKLKDKLKIYVYELTHGKNASGSDYPWNIVLIALYLMCLAILITGRDYLGIWRLVALFLGRSAIWLYILMGERSPDRITHSLYFIEIVVLLCLLNMLIERLNNESLVICIIPAIMFTILGVSIFADNIQYVKTNQNFRNDINKPYIELYEYMASNNTNFYFIDTYSSVSYSEKVFGSEAHISRLNSNTMGGWATFSPIESAKYRRMSITNMYDSLFNENVYFVNDKDRNIKWLNDYYLSDGYEIEIVPITTIADKFDIYKLTR